MEVIQWALLIICTLLLLLFDFKLLTKCFQVKNLGEGLSLEDRLLKRYYSFLLSIRHEFVFHLFMLKLIICRKEEALKQREVRYMKHCFNNCHVVFELQTLNFKLDNFFSLIGWLKLFFCISMMKSFNTKDSNAISMHCLIVACRSR